MAVEHTNAWADRLECPSDWTKTVWRCRAGAVLQLRPAPEPRSGSPDRGLLRNLHRVITHSLLAVVHYLADPSDAGTAGVNGSLPSARIADQL